MSEDKILRRLAALPREFEPPVDLWPGVAAGLAPTRRRSAPPPLALAAMLLLAVGAAALLLQGRSGPPGTGFVPARPPGDGRTLARTVERDYSGALRSLAQGLPQPPRTLDTGPAELSLRTLDHAAEELRAAIARDPGALYLVDLLASTHRLRLRVLREVSLSGAWGEEPRRIES